MSGEALEFISGMMKSLNLPYAFMRFQTDRLPECYFVGEYIGHSSPHDTENGLRESAFILRGYTRRDWLLLENAKEKIQKCLPHKAILPGGGGLSITYDYAAPVPVSHPDNKSIKINLLIQEWMIP